MFISLISPSTTESPVLIPAVELPKLGVTVAFFSLSSSSCLLFASSLANRSASSLCCFSSCSFFSFPVVVFLFLLALVFVFVFVLPLVVFVLPLLPVFYVLFLALLQV
ncbi:hypothetical protein [Mesomycoplasma dispar]|uniref:hypothetical protein n=1 Tax=Mesomycoplasma dispar TaxID=86660 RepID=UPI001186ADC5|nr:hypothetical protein [Mesomycoplasma dispar]